MCWHPHSQTHSIPHAPTPPNHPPTHPLISAATHALSRSTPPACLRACLSAFLPFPNLTTRTHTYARTNEHAHARYLAKREEKERKLLKHAIEDEQFLFDNEELTVEEKKRLESLKEVYDITTRQIKQLDGEEECVVVCVCVWV